MTHLFIEVLRSLDIHQLSRASKNRTNQNAKRKMVQLKDYEVMDYLGISLDHLCVYSFEQRCYCWGERGLWKCLLSLPYGLTLNSDLALPETSSLVSCMPQMAG